MCFELTVEAFVPVAAQGRVQAATTAIIHVLAIDRVVLLGHDELTCVDQPHEADVVQLAQQARVRLQV